MCKNLIQKTLVVAMFALGSSVVCAQESTVKINSSITQTQTGSAEGTQEMDLGNVKGSGTSNVTIDKEITQTMSGKGKQLLSIGNADDGKSNVTVGGTITQDLQGGAKVDQQMRIGDASNGGTSNVTINSDIEQTSAASGTDGFLGFGAFPGFFTKETGQYMEIGGASGGTSNVTVSGKITQTQERSSRGSQSMRIGNVY